MKTTTSTRPWALTAACAPVPAARVVAGAPQLPIIPQVHQVQIQAELALEAVHTGVEYGTTGSTVNGSSMGTKRLFDVARGVPPRGRPV